MKRTLLILLMPILVTVSCKKKDAPACPEVTATAAASEVITLRNYMQANAIVAIEDARGFFYRIENAGTGTAPNACSNITVDYVGKLTNGGTFDNGNNVSFNLGGLITGWQLGIPRIASGGRIVLYLPPSLGYGPNPQGSIPGNSILIFEINLKAVR